MNKTLISVALVAGLLAAGAAQAAYVTFSGIDNNGNPSLQVSPTNASGAESQFKAALSGAGTEDFETYAVGTSAPLSLNFGSAGMATMTGGDGMIAGNSAGKTDGNGRYSVTKVGGGDGLRFWEVDAGGTGDFNIDFSVPIAAFGFYGVDIGDFLGTVSVGLWSSGTPLTTFAVPSAATTVADGSIIYFGVVATTSAEEFTQVRFRTTSGNEDVFAFDNMTIGVRQQVTIPAPASLALVGLGLIGLGLSRRRA
jgi:hypothetical protein